MSPKLGVRGAARCQIGTSDDNIEVRKPSSRQINPCNVSVKVLEDFSLADCSDSYGAYHKFSGWGSSHEI
jgi:hypothetical protein